MTSPTLRNLIFHGRLSNAELSCPEPMMPADQPNRAELCFGPFRLGSDGTLYRGSARIPLPPKEHAVLQLLIANAGLIVPASRLRQAAWGETHVSPDSLPRCVSSLRALLGDKNCIATVYKRGYRFNLAVSPSAISVLRGSHQPPDTILKSQTKPWFERSVRSIQVLPRLVILPFASSEGVPDKFRSGISEETMLRLARSRTAVADVIARDSVFALAARGITSQEVGLALRADLVLTGKITALPAHFRLRAEMIRVADAVQIWVEDFLVPRASADYADARMAKRISMRIFDTFAVQSSPLSAPPLAKASSAGKEAEASHGDSDLFWLSRTSPSDGAVTN